MNKVIILAGILFGIANTATAQLRTNTTATSTSIEDDTQKIEALKSLLVALDTKEAWLRSNPKEFEIAKKSNWFINADKTRKDTKAQIEAIKLKNK